MSEMNASSDPYRDIAELYDLEHETFDDDIEFYLSFIESVGDPVLELGCGTGRLLVPIARPGFRVTGLDRSPAMLNRARLLLDQHQLASQVQLFERSMTNADLAPGGPFGVAILGLNSILHLPTQAEQRKCLESTFRALDPRGLLLIDILNPSPEALRGLDHALSHQGSWWQEDETRVDRFTSTRVMSSLQRIETDLWYDLMDAGGALRRKRTAFSMRYLHLAELELLLELAGFAEWHVYGSYDLEPFGDHSERIIVAAEVSR
ncbi:MAG: methyltransferase domain-containing protein [Thermomicrobiales bacterium]